MPLLPDYVYQTHVGTWLFIIVLGGGITVLPMIFLVSETMRALWIVWAVGLVVAPQVAGNIAINAYIRPNQFNYFEAGIRTLMPVEVMSNIVVIWQLASVAISWALGVVVVLIIAAIINGMDHLKEEIARGKTGATIEQWEAAKLQAEKDEIAAAKEEDYQWLQKVKAARKAGIPGAF